MDETSGFPPSNGYDAIWIFVDKLRRWCVGYFSLFRGGKRPVAVAPSGGELTLEPTWLRRGVGHRAVAPERVRAETVFKLTRRINVLHTFPSL